MQMSPSIAALAKDFIKYQAEMPVAKKGAVNPFFKSKYADFPSILEACLPILNKHNLLLLQSIGSLNGLPAVTSLLAHASGEWIQDTASAPPGKADAQGFGSVYTYLKRYGAQALGVIPSEDDDGNYASHGSSAPLTQAARQPVPANTYTGTEDQKNKLFQSIVAIRKNASVEAMKKLHEDSLGKDFLTVLKNVPTAVNNWGAGL